MFNFKKSHKNRTPLFLKTNLQKCHKNGTPCTLFDKQIMNNTLYCPCAYFIIRYIGQLKNYAFMGVINK